jgi:hypothetical protein
MMMLMMSKGPLSIQKNASPLLAWALGPQPRDTLIERWKAFWPKKFLHTSIHHLSGSGSLDHGARTGIQL